MAFNYSTQTNNGGIMKRSLLLFALLLIATLAIAAPVSQAKAAQVAQNVVLERLGSGFSVSDHQYLDSRYDQSYIFVFNLNPRGFILVAADDAAMPVIGYGTGTKWLESEIPIQLQAMLENWQDQLHFIVNQNLEADQKTQNEWEFYSQSNASFAPNRNLRNVNPLITTRWGQGTYYNAQTPANTPVGCVATSMAQIMRYWSFPAVGSGSHSYNAPGYGVQTANFGETSYNWAAMPDYLTSHNPAVATICYHAGVSVNMGYAPSGSGAYSTAVAPALINYFNYNDSAQIKYKNSYTDTNWHNLLKGELDNARPIYYAGSSYASGGHAFLLDGYQNSNFHVNWGWNGTYNGYFALTALNPGGENFTNSQEAVIGIMPGEIELSTTFNEGFEGAAFPPQDWTVTASTFARSNNSPISGGYSARYYANRDTSGKQLRTPALVVNSTSPPFTFKAKRSITDRGETIKLGYSTSPTGPWTYFPTSAVLTEPVQTFTYPLSGLTAGNYYFVLETYSTNTTTIYKNYFVDDVTGPDKYMPTVASLNLNAWDAGSLNPGDQTRSGNIFTLANVGTGTLTVNSVTDLSGTAFSTNFNSNINLVYGQSHDFGFVYEPLDYGTDNVSFIINTNAGSLTIALSGSALADVFYDSFEDYNDFALSCSPWTQYDQDGVSTWGVNGYSWPNVNYTGSWMIFNPSQTSPAMTDIAAAKTGEKYASCWAANGAANNDWLVTPELTLTTPGTVSFYARAFDSGYNQEKMKVMYSTTTNATSAFTNYLAGSASASITVSSTTWTNYTYDIPANCKYIAIQCVSNDQFALFVDEFKVSDNSTPPTPSFGNLEGYVYRAGTTDPISNALVRVGTKEVLTNAVGYYIINNILTGTVNAKCSAPGMFYHPSTAAGIVISQGITTSRDFELTWGEIAADPSSLVLNLYQGETGTASITLSNPGGTAPTLYAGYFGAAVRGSRADKIQAFSQRKPAASVYGSSIPPIQNAAAVDRYNDWFSYGSIADANYFSSATTERGNFFILSDFSLMDGDITVSQLRTYFYNPSSAPWGTTAANRRFTWKVYTVSPLGEVSLVHTSAAINLASIAEDTYVLSEYTIPTPITIPAGYDFIVTVVPAGTGTTNAGKPQSLATDVSSDNGIVISGNSISMMGLNLILDAYVDGNEWLYTYNFEGSIAPGGTAILPIEFNAIDVSEGAKNGLIYVYNDANYVSPDARGDVMTIPITLNVTAPSDPVAILLGESSWTAATDIDEPVSSGNIFTLKNGGPGILTIDSISGLAGSPFTTNLDTSIALAQNETHSFGFTFNPSENGIYDIVFTITSNGGTKTIVLKGYAGYSFEGFEGASFPPDGWLIVDADGDGYNWIQYTVSNAAHTGSYCAASASYINESKAANMQQRVNASGNRGALTPNNWLITPRLAIPDDGIISWWVASQDPSWPQEKYSVKLSTTTNAISSFTVPLFTETLQDGDWHYRQIDLSAYAGQEVYIAFQHHDSTDWFMMKIDDVLLPPLAAPLVFGNISGLIQKAGTDERLGGAVVNVAGRSYTTTEDGYFEINNIVADTYPLRVSKAGYISHNANVSIPENATLNYNVWLDYAQFASPETNFEIAVEEGETAAIALSLQNIGTADLDWDAECGIWGGNSIIGAALNQNFNAANMTGWAGSIGPNTGLYNNVGMASSIAWVFASYQMDQAQFLVTPQMQASSGSNLSFWYKQYNNTSESFQVKISTTTDEIAEFSTLRSFGPLTDTEWHQANVSLDAYAGQDIYICFYYPRTDGDQYGYIILDDITGPALLIPYSDWLEVNPDEGSIAAGASAEVNLEVDTAGLPLGTYTAQAWFFDDDALNSPFKVYVTLNVIEAMVLDAPQNMVIAQYDEYVAMAWDSVDNALDYKIYVSDNPYGTYTYLTSTEGTDIEIPIANLTDHGISNRAFFRIVADSNLARSANQLTVQKKNSSQLHLNFLGKTKDALKLNKL